MTCLINSLILILKFVNGCHGYGYQNYGYYGPIDPNIARTGFDYIASPRNDNFGYDYSESERYHQSLTSNKLTVKP